MWSIYFLVHIFWYMFFYNFSGLSMLLNPFFPTVNCVYNTCKKYYSTIQVRNICNGLFIFISWFLINYTYSFLFGYIWYWNGCGGWRWRSHTCRARAKSGFSKRVPINFRALMVTHLSILVVVVSYYITLKLTSLTLHRLGIDHISITNLVVQIE